MRIEPINPIEFGITIKPIKKVPYAPGCWNEITEGKFKEYSFKIYNNFVEYEKGSTLIILKKCGNWVKSKLKYVLNGKRKTLWSYAKGVKND